MNKTKVNGTNGIRVAVLADSVNAQGNRLTTLEIEYPRFILSELNTHRMLSKNSASSRAIPLQKMHEHIRENPAMPVNWGRNRSGMQATEELRFTERKAAEGVWIAARDQMLSHSNVLSQIGLHKQVANRITEPWMMMKTVISGTEWSNFLWLRDHEDAQPEFAHLAFLIRCALETSEPQILYPGEWHTPYVETERRGGTLQYYTQHNDCLTPEQALVVSASCCAQVSYRRNDETLEKAQQIFDRLINSEPVHASPVEHQATPVRPNLTFITPDTWPQGVTHQDRSGRLWSANFCGWIQHRKQLPNESR